MKYGNVLFLFAIILPSFSTAVPSHDSHTTYLQKRQGPSTTDPTSTPPPSSKPADLSGMPSRPPGSQKEKESSGGKESLLGTEHADSREGKNSTGSLGPGIPKSKMANKAPDISGLGPISIAPPAGSVGDATLTRPSGDNTTKPEGSKDLGNEEDEDEGAPGGTNIGDALNKTIGGAMNKSSSASLQVLQKILNHTLSTLPGLENLSDQVEKMMAGQLEDAIEKAQNTSDSPGSRTDVQEGFEGSANATTNKTVSIQAPVEMNGTDSQGKACETYGYITLSATTLTTLSGLFQSLVKLEKTVSQDGSKKALTILQKARAQVSFTMFSVIKLTATPAVTNCHVPPSETTFSTQIQANVSMCAEMITKVERDLKAGKTTASKSTELGIDASLGVNSTLNSTVGNIGSNSTDAAGSAGSNTSPILTSGAADNTTSPGGLSTSSVGATAAPGDQKESSTDGGLPMNNTGSTGTPGDAGLGDSAPNDRSSSTATDAVSSPGGGSSSSFNMDQFAEVKASFAAAVQVTTGLITSKPSQGKQGVHIGATFDSQVNVNIKSRVSVSSTVIDHFLDRVNGGSGAQAHDALRNPQIQQNDGMNILQQVGGGVFGSMFTGISGSAASDSASYPGGATSPDSTGPSATNPGSTGSSATSPSSSSYPGESPQPGGVGSGSTPTSNSPNSTGGSGNGPAGYPTGTDTSPGSGLSGGQDLTGTGGGPSSGPGMNSTGPALGGSSDSSMGNDAGSGSGPGSSGGSGSSGPGSSGGSGSSGPGSSGGSGSSGPGSSGGSGFGSSGGSGLGSSGGMSGGGANGNCVCQPDSSTHLRIRSLEAQLERVHRVMHKRGLTEL
ncbi:hypothetical protein MJO28_004324 [Puccinia striiformis f. sp. tritici]|uniref:Uncharacterized protein n=1 Tax=Puccinia striiformis f. sp. tritici TaxID=168172 RepID=A0ACC0ENL7_9BASI|nr:hypothetical protein Pst134EB_008227 [Puccinia striiformis f. sp. tritici]KAI7957229.1 hypothetical protein MJO28_004324 [Puccinia striiformis f. sp. tritici]KAI7963535.1 hypothetical protein MJO29_003962 [Puccinia striiformis f. sp. tritici]